MGEEEAIDRSRHGPVVLRDLTRDLQQLGVQPGAAVPHDWRRSLLMGDGRGCGGGQRAALPGPPPQISALHFYLPVARGGDGGEVERRGHFFFGGGLFFQEFLAHSQEFGEG